MWPEKNSCKVAVEDLYKEPHLKQPLKGGQGGGQAQLSQELVPEGWLYNQDGPSLASFIMATWRSMAWEDLVAQVDDFKEKTEPQVAESVIDNHQDIKLHLRCHR